MKKLQKEKKEADLNDILNNIEFSGGNIPIVNVRTLNIIIKKLRL